MDRERGHEPDADEEDLSSEVLTPPRGDVYLPYRLDNSEGFVENLERKVDERMLKLDDIENEDLDHFSWDDEDLWATPDDWDDEL